MKYCKFLLPIVFLAALLVGCDIDDGSPAAYIEDIADTASGAIHGAAETGKKVGETVKATVQDVQERIGNVREGMDKLSEGQELIQKGITGKE